MPDHKWCNRCGMKRLVDDTGQSAICQALDCEIGNAPARAKWCTMERLVDDSEVRAAEARAACDKMSRAAERNAADQSFEASDDMGRWTMLQMHLREQSGKPVPAKWVEWLLIYVRPPSSGPGVLVPTPPGKRSGWQAFRRDPRDA